MRDVDLLQKSWDAAARADPLWAILTAPGKDGGRWDVAEFFDSGRGEIAAALDYVASLGIAIPHRRALDFGCGVGRLTQALVEHFGEVDGVDVAPAMIEQAREFNRHGDRCRYHVNAAPHLGIFPDNQFDFVYSSLVLQHVGPQLAAGYIRELVRVLVPGGIALFQVPSELASVTSDPGRQTIADRPLANDAFRARLTPDRDRLVGPPGSRIEIGVHVTNASPLSWPAGSPGAHRAVNLGNHWLTRRGKLLVMDDARCGLPVDVPPGGEVDLVLSVTLPDRSGDYLLELDMVQEHVAWFGDEGSLKACLPVTVEGERSAYGGQALARRGRRGAETRATVWTHEALAMHGVPRQRVLALLGEAGARVLDVREDSAAGTEWVSYRYAVTKD